MKRISSKEETPSLKDPCVDNTCDAPFCGCRMFDLDALTKVLENPKIAALLEAETGKPEAGDLICNPW
jgi:hypothetical protein